ncbi:MAG TPA: tetratricopeptide repeat protein [Tepidisphaeraceae bacterium]|nr:tetratricopeptide repeat protein [Tepidisphaeraceae bacterium]
MPSLQHLFARAMAQMQAGRPDEARHVLDEILRQNPDHFEALIHLARIERMAGHHANAVERLRHAVSLKKSDAQVRHALAEALSAAGDLPQAVSAYQKAIELQPGFSEAHYALGCLLDRMGSSQQALTHLQRAGQLRPRDPGPVVTMTNVLLGLGKVAESIEAGRRSISLAPRSAIAHINYANALLKNGQQTDAADQFRIAITCDPTFGPAHNGLGVTLEAQKDLDQAAFHLERCIELSPGFPLAWINLGEALLRLGEVSRAIETAQRGLRMHPTIDLWGVQLLSLCYLDTPQEKLLSEHQQMLEQFPADPSAPPARIPADGRRIRIGYFSPDFHDHPVAYFFEPLLKHHDRNRVEIFCYSARGATDEVAQRLQSYAATWHNIAPLSNSEAMARIRKDQLDILIDLAGHTSGSPVSLLLHRLADIQVSYLGYPTTMGLPTIDVRLTDAIADPPGQNDAYYSERLVHLPGCFCCFRPPDNQPDVSPLPAIDNGPITFGSLHNLAKISERTLDLWGAVLKAVPNSRLLIFRDALMQRAQKRLRAAFEERGIDISRLIMRNKRPDTGYLAVYHDVDIALDTVPFTGHTTACQSLLMGVPILTLLGDSHRHRLVATILTHAGYPQWVAETPEEYVKLAQTLAADISGLAEIRQSLRAKFLASKLCDGEQFTRDFESTLASLLK